MLATVGGRGKVAAMGKARRFWKTKRRKALLVSTAVIAFVYALFLIWANTYRLPDSLRQAPLAPPPPREASTLPFPSGKFERYEDYLKALLAADASQEAAALCLELGKLYTDNDIDHQYPDHFDDCRTTGSLSLAYAHDKSKSGQPLYWNPYVPEQVRWLRGKAGYLALLHRLGRCRQWPAPTLQHRNDYLNLYGAEFPFLPFISLFYSGNMLAAEARLRYQEGDFAAARESIQDLYLLASLLRSSDSTFEQGVLLYWVREANRVVSLWLEDSSFPKSELAALQSTLNRIEPLLFPPDELGRIFTDHYLEMRSELVYFMSQNTWLWPFYGWGGYENVNGSMCGWPVEYSEYHDLPWLGTTKVPNLPKIFSHSHRAMFNRICSAAALKEYDTFYRQAIEWVGRPYPEFMRDKPRYDDPSHDRYFLMKRLRPTENTALPYFPEVKLRRLGAETRTHLLRLALGLRLEPARPLALKAETLPNQPHNPWRDPFTDAPLRTDTPTSPTLLYSLGPDLKDQRGALAYDPTNGTVSAGDIILRCR